VTATVADLRAQLYRVTLRRPWAVDVPANHVIASQVTTTDGRCGHGFTWLPQIGPHAAFELVARECRDFVRGGPTAPTVVWDRLWAHLHEAGPGGLTTVAMAAVDTALWDLRLRDAGVSLPDHLGARRERVATYGSGVNYDFTHEELAAQTRRWVEAGHRAVKIKVGHPDLDDDMARVALVRELIGPDRRLMVDANQRWDPATATRAIRRLERWDLAWVEEPLLADDIPGLRALRAAVDVPIAVGENHYTVHQYRALLSSGACDIVQPNVARVGGITPFLRIAELAAVFGVPVWPHHLAEISAQLAMCLPLEAMVEAVEDASFESLRILTAPGCVTLDGPAAYRLGHGTGLGLRIDPTALERLDG
jgi:L-alanine-DL-glutamate epimerase-like enolase superfamily enzyme